MPEQSDPGMPVDDCRASSPTAAPASIRQRLLLLFCCGHALFLLWSLNPPPPIGDSRGHPAVEFYRAAFGGRQQWNMFDTIPVLHSLDVWIEGPGSEDAKPTLGCVLPGFTEYPEPEKARYYNAFYRLLLSNENVAYRGAYLRKVAQTLAVRKDIANGPWSVVVRQEYTRNLFHVRRDGQIGMAVVNSFDLPGASDALP